MKTLWLVLGLLALLAGCNTFEGIGKDIRSAGEKIEESSKKK